MFVTGSRTVEKLSFLPDHSDYCVYCTISKVTVSELLFELEPATLCHNNCVSGVWAVCARSLYLVNV